MPLTITQVDKPAKVRDPGEWKRAAYHVTFDSSYPTGGEDLALSGAVAVLDAGRVAGTLVHSVRHDRAAGKLMAYDNAGAEIGNATNLSAETVRVYVIGR